MAGLHTILQQLFMEEVQNKVNGMFVRLAKNLASIQLIELAVIQKISFDNLQLHVLATLLYIFNLGGMAVSIQLKLAIHIMLIKMQQYYYKKYYIQRNTRSNQQSQLHCKSTYKL